MSVENKHSHASFLPVFLGVFTTFWVPTAASGSVETETHTGLLEWAFPKFMTKIKKKKGFQNSLLSLLSPCAARYMTDMYETQKDSHDTLQVFICCHIECNSWAAPFTGTKYQQKLYDYSCLPLLWDRGVRGCSASFFFLGYILFLFVDYLLSDFQLCSVHPSFLLCFWRKLILWDQTLCLSFLPSKF